MSTDWQSIAAAKRAERDAKLPQEWRLDASFLKDVNESSDVSVMHVPRTCGLLSEDDIALTENYDATALLDELASGQIKAIDVATAFCKRAAIAHQLTGCLTEMMFDQALERAKMLDEYMSKEGKALGPLHGLPISLKLTIVLGYDVKGVASTIGFVSFISRGLAKQNATIVDILLELGAVVFVKTNLPQTLMTADSENNIYGRVLNPHRLNLTAGGSSGGEGALIALRGSLLGVGTDIAGSVRIPALCDAIYGFKPTANRVPYTGQTSPARPGAFPIAPCCGPLATSVRDLGLFLKNAIGDDPWARDEAAVGGPWREVPPVPRGKTLRIGLFVEEKATYPVHPVALRALQTATKALEAAGHAVVPIPDDAVPSIAATLKLSWQYFTMDPKKTAVGHVAASGEPFIKSIATMRHPELADWAPGLDDVYGLNVQRRMTQKAWKDVIVREGLDAILMPTYQGSPPPHDMYGLPPYTVLANLLDYPAAALPFLKADKKLDEPYVRDVKYTPPYNKEAMEGGPCGVQVMGKPMKDEELMRIIEVVDAVLKKAS
ncbi:amidase signature domain-containing protein [Lineolata rhizophorae]|uniref:amidase n=1 Tax=Lineolata rhizophorae TaxID=578093 RepID=A0A6A6P773_9PEZI|nr:amidase signature domain-containing protein [Lineolata rhizophorae]